MNSATSQQNSGIDFHDVLFAIFRHKWKVLIFTALGLAAAAAFHLLTPPRYQSEAKLLVKYVLERGTIDVGDSQTEVAGRYSDSQIGAEVAILSSRDLAVKVAESLGPDRLLAGEPGQPSLNRAVGVVGGGLSISAPGGSNVISVAFLAKNPQLAQPVLEEFIRHYFDKHLEVHRSIQAFDFVSQQKDLVRARISDLDSRIRTLKEQAGITSLADSDANLQAQILRTRQELMAAEAERAQQTARSIFLSRALKPSAPQEDDEKAPAIPPATVQQYQLVLSQLALSRRSEAELLTKYTEEAAEVRTTQARIQQLAERQTALEKEYPALTAVAASNSSQGSTLDLLGEQAGLAAIEARKATLQGQLKELEAAAVRMGAVSSQLHDLESQRQVERTTFADFQTKLEKSRIDEALDPSKIPNISALQKPTPPAPVAGATMKITAGLAGGGLALGVVSALLFGLVLDPTIKRPAELESRLRIPMLLSIPTLDQRRPKLPGGAAARTPALPNTRGPAGKVAPWEPGHFIRPFAEAIRDRLILGFELKKTLHKPKLIGVTGLAGGEGSSTMAGGLAASLSETGEGKVLLVDMNADNPEMRPFFEGSASSSLLEALQAESALPAAGENLFLATGESGAQGSLSIAPRRFYDLMPVLRASHFDYIIFDLPPLEHSGATLAISGSLDKVLLMVETEKNQRKALQRAHAELVAARADVSAIVNKAPTGMPNWILG